MPGTYADTLKRKNNNLEFTKVSQISDIPAKIQNKIQTVSQNTFVEISTSVFRDQYSHQIQN